MTSPRSLFDRLPSLGRFRIRFNQDFFFERNRKLPQIPDTPEPWFDLGADGSIHLYLPKVEMGQGIHTVLAQIAADELDVPVAGLVVHQAGLRRGFDPALFFTADSTSTKDLYGPLRRAAASVRESIRIEAARQLDVPVDEVETRDGTCVVSTDPARSRSYAEVITEAPVGWRPTPPPGGAHPQGGHRHVGRDQPRIDGPPKLTGAAVYGYDARVEGMFHGAVARPPRFGARLVRAAEGLASGQPGVVAIVIEKGFAGVVARTVPAARRAVDLLDVEWASGTTIDAAVIDAAVTVQARGGTTIQDDGDARGALRAGRVHEAEFRTGLVAHATLEPQAALVDVRDERVIAYLSSQSPRDARRWIARASGRRIDDVEVVPLYLGGAFGRKGGHDVGAEAARLSAAVGAPVHVGWSLSEDLRHGWFRPPTHHRLRAALDERGRLHAIEHIVVSGDVSFHFPELVPGRAFGVWLAGADPHASEGALVLYRAPHRRTVSQRARIPVPTSFFRSVGLFPNVFAIESFIDELAHEGGADPLAFRLAHLDGETGGETGDRLARVLRVAAERSNWAAAPGPGRARGLAACFYRGSAIALVAEVSDRDGSGIRVERMTAAVDPGLVVNPDGARAQVEGAIVMGLGSTLFERAVIEDGMLRNDNLDTYRIMTMRDTPDIETVFTGTADVPLGGLGELGMGPVAAAVGNAIFALTGERKRSVPFFPVDAATGSGTGAPDG